MESRQLGFADCAPATEFHPPVGQIVQHGDPLRDPEWMVDVERQQHDPVTKPDAIGLRRQEGQNFFRRGTVGKALQEMVLGEPHGAVP